MSSTLCFRKTPRQPNEFGSCKHPLKGVFANRYYDHDGSLGGGMITIDDTDIDWLRGVRDGGSFDKDDTKLLNNIIHIIENGDTVDMWFEV